jgi:hypothetical protein
MSKLKNLFYWYNRETPTPQRKDNEVIHKEVESDEFIEITKIKDPEVITEEFKPPEIINEYKQEEKTPSPPPQDSSKSKGVFCFSCLVVFYLLYRKLCK